MMQINLLLYLPDLLLQLSQICYYILGFIFPAVKVGIDLPVATLSLLKKICYNVYLMMSKYYFEATNNMKQYIADGFQFV